MGFLKTITRYIFPRKCIGCKTLDFWICEKCLAQISKSYENPFSWSYSIFEYKNKVIKKAIWLLKFNGKHSVLMDLEKIFKQSFLEFLEKKKLNGKEIILIPIPITKRSMAKRKYNQSLLIAKILSKDTGNVKVKDSILEKTKNHLSQNKIRNRSQRLDNVKNSFRVKNPKDFSGKIVILVDDVTTTGATLFEARKILKESGAKKVFGFTVAH